VRTKKTEELFKEREEKLQPIVFKRTSPMSTAKGRGQKELNKREKKVTAVEGRVPLQGVYL